MALLLAIESSCDETTVAIVRGSAGQPTSVLASEISSQIALHREHGGVVPNWLPARGSDWWTRQSLLSIHKPQHDPLQEVLLGPR
jgi:tRNA A37 threonylcarbamoyltransferase TsaD